MIRKKLKYLILNSKYIISSKIVTLKENKGLYINSELNLNYLNYLNLHLLNLIQVFTWILKSVNNNHVALAIQTINNKHSGYANREIFLAFKDPYV